MARAPNSLLHARCNYPCEEMIGTDLIALTEDQSPRGQYERQ